MPLELAVVTDKPTFEEGRAIKPLRRGVVSSDHIPDKRSF